MAESQSNAQREAAAGKTRVFISYSRRDIGFVDRLEAALKARGVEPSIDRAEIYAFEDWWKRIEALITKADTIVFVLSPDAVASEVCKREVDFAASLNKRFAPIVAKAVADATVPEQLRRLNFILFDNEAKFEGAADKLAEALAADIEWIRKHTEIGELARRWSEAGRPGPIGLLLRSPLLEDAERWIASRPENAPLPTQEAQALIAESRRAATDQARRETRRTRIIASASIAAAAAFAVLGWYFYQSSQTALRSQSLFLADLSRQQTNELKPEIGMLLALEGLQDKTSSQLTARIRPYVPEVEFALDYAWPTYMRTAPFDETGKIKNASFSPDGKLVLTTTEGGAANIWEVASGKRLRSVPSNLLMTASFSPDGTRVLSVGADEAKIWRVFDGALVASFRSSPQPSNVAQPSDFIGGGWSPDGTRVYTISSDYGQPVKVWDAATGNLSGKFDGGGLQRAAAFSPDGRLLVTPGLMPPKIPLLPKDEAAVIWDLSTGKELYRLPQFSRVYNIAFSPDGGLLLVETEDNTARVWDFKSKTIKYALGSASAVFSPDGKRFIVRGFSKEASLRDLATGESIATFKTDAMSFAGGAVSADGKRVLFYNFQEPSASLYDAETGGKVAGIKTLPTYVYLDGASFSPDGSKILTYSEREAQVWQLSGKDGPRFTRGDEKLWGSKFAPDGSRVLTVGHDDPPRLWDTTTGQELMTFPEFTVFDDNAVFSPDSTKLLLSAGKFVSEWDIATAAKISQFAIPAELVGSIAYAPSGRQAIIAAGNIVQLWDLRGNVRERIRFTGHTDKVGVAVLSPDGSKLITTAYDETIRLWNAATGKELHREAGARAMNIFFLPDSGHAVIVIPEMPICVWNINAWTRTRCSDGQMSWRGGQVELSQDGTRLLINPYDGEGRVWDTQSGQDILRFRRKDLGDELTFALADGSRLIAKKREVANDTNVNIVDVSTGKPVGFVRNYFSTYPRPKVSADGRAVVVTGDDEAHIKRVFPSTDEIIKRAKEMLSFCLSPQQREEFHLPPDPPDWCYEMGKKPYYRPPPDVGRRVKRIPVSQALTIRRAPARQAAAERLRREFQRSAARRARDAGACRKMLRLAEGHPRGSRQ